MCVSYDDLHISPCKQLSCPSICSVDTGSIFPLCIPFSSEDRRHPAQTAHVVPKLRTSSAETHEVSLVMRTAKAQLEITCFIRQHSTAEQYSTVTLYLVCTSA